MHRLRRHGRDNPRTLGRRRGHIRVRRHADVCELAALHLALRARVEALERERRSRGVDAEDFCNDRLAVPARDAPVVPVSVPAPRRVVRETPDTFGLLAVVAADPPRARSPFDRPIDVDAINALFTPTIHAMRLNFYEFGQKYYEKSNAEYKPFQKTGGEESA